MLARDENLRSRLGTVLYNLAECIRIAVILLAPTMPTLPERVNAQIGLFKDPLTLAWEEAGQWGKVKPGTTVTKGEALFPRIDIKSMEEETMEKPAAPVTDSAQEKKAEEVPFITIEDFARLDLRVAEVISCEKMAQRRQLLVSRCGSGGKRTVVSGIAQYYQPEDLIGQKVVLVANLKPTKLRGTLSQGMILAASDPGDSEVEVLTVKRIAPGNRVK